MKDLTNEQLCKLAQAGDKQAVSLLIEANLPFVRKVANQIVDGVVNKRGAKWQYNEFGQQRRRKRHFWRSA